MFNAKPEEMYNADGIRAKGGTIGEGEQEELGRETVLPAPIMESLQVGRPSRANMKPTTLC